MGNEHPANLSRQFRSLFSEGRLAELGEGQLLDRFLIHHDEVAFEELIARHGPMVLGVCRRWLDDPNDVDDAFQATFLVLLRKGRSLRDSKTLSQWLYGVSLRVARRARSQAARRPGSTRFGFARTATNPNSPGGGRKSRAAGHR